MCGRFTYMFTWREIHEHLSSFLEHLNPAPGVEIEEQPNRYNIAPTQPILTIFRQGSEMKPSLMRWGLVPGWVKDPRDFPLIINARAETMAEKASFRNSLKNQRCLVPASGYYEWKKNADGSKTPHYITRADKQPMLFAGLHSTWEGPNGEEIDTVAIVTSAARGVMKKLHDRVPAILLPQQAADWVDTAGINAEKAGKLIADLEQPDADIVPVSTRVNSPKNDDEGLIVPVYENQPEKPAKPVTSKKPNDQLDLF